MDSSDIGEGSISQAGRASALAWAASAAPKVRISTPLTALPRVAVSHSGRGGCVGSTRDASTAFA